MEVTRWFRVHYLDLKAYLAKVYRMKDYDVLRSMGITSGLFPEYFINGEMPDTPNLNQQMDNVRRGRRTRNLPLILNMLCQDGFIPAGKYVIDTRPPVDPYIEYSKLLEKLQDPDHPDCVAFKKVHPDPTFNTKAGHLDKHFRDMMENQ